MSCRYFSRRKPVYFPMLSLQVADLLGRSGLVDRNQQTADPDVLSNQPGTGGSYNAESRLVSG